MVTKRTVVTSVVTGVLALSLGSVTPVSAWFFNPPTNVARANGKPINNTCVAWGEVGDCQFYNCFEERLACGSSGYMLRFGRAYCRRFQLSVSSFTQQGQDFIKGAGQCLTQALLPYYKQDQVDCHRLSHAAFDAVSSCYANHGFCQVADSNVAAFVDVFSFRPQHLFQRGALKIWREILQLTYHCEPERVHKFANYIFRFLSGIWTFFRSTDA